MTDDGWRCLDLLGTPSVRRAEECSSGPSECASAQKYKNFRGAHQLEVPFIAGHMY